MKLSGIAPPARALLHDGIALAADGAAVIRDADSVPESFIVQTFRKSFGKS